MRFSPFRDFIANVVLNTGRTGWLQTDRKVIRKQKRKSRVGALAPAEILERRALLAGPQLVSVAPNTGGFLADGQTLTEAPRELTITLSPGAAIDATTVQDSIVVSRPGTDGTFGTSDDLSVPLGYVGVGPLSNQITVRFAESLVVDQYRLTVRGTLLNVDGEAFNNGVNKNLEFRVDFGGQVVSVVPQPVVRSVSLTDLDVSRLRGGDTISIDAGSGPVTFEFVNTQLGGTARPGNVAVSFNPSQSSTQIATAFLNRLIQSPLASPSTPAVRRLTATTISDGLLLASPSFTPVVRIQSAQADVVAVTDGELSQATDTVVVHFNKNPLRAADAENPGFYQLANIADGFLRLPQSVSYSASGNNAVLKFAAPLPQATYKLTVGAPLSVDETLAQAVNLGTLYANTGSPTLVGFLGDRGGVSNDSQDYDLYAFSTGAAGTSGTVSVLQADPSFTSGLRFTVFRADGTIVNFGTVSAGGTFSMTGLAASTQYWLGISAGVGGIVAHYNPVTGTPGPAGVGLGSYKVQISLAGNLTQNGDTSSFALSTSLGQLGTAGFTIDGSITPPGTVALPPEPGGNDEPGHRQIPVEGESNDTDNNGQAPRIPTAIRTFRYNFRQIYGQDPQGNDLYNQITEAQKQRAREIFEIYSRYMGVEFVETTDQGLIVAFGDPRAVMPNVPEGAVGGIAGQNGDGQEIALINASADYSTESEFGEGFFNIAIHEIAHSLGFAHSYDAPGVMSGGAESLNPGVPSWKGTEAVYPGDVNLVAAQRIYSPYGTDINLYGFRLDQAGTFRAETIAQRLLDSNGNVAPSLLDAQLSLFQETYNTASVTSDFGTNKTVTIRLAAKTAGAAGNSIQVAVTRASLPAGAAPTISVSGTTISVVLNTNGGTTAQQLVTALNGNSAAAALISAEITAGTAATNLASAATGYSPLRLAGGATNRTLISRNDDYFGRDSLLSLPLTKGQYFLAVSAKGNSNFDPTVSGTGYGGRTDGDYRLQLNFTPETSAGQSLQTVTSVPFDGDLDSKAGGTFETWFQVAPTIFVDKLNSDDWDPQGTLEKPYGNISTALAAAAPGQIVRIVGNAGEDGEAGSVEDNRAYLLGYDSLGNAAEDGADFIVPKDVTVMIDAGAILKLRGAIIDVGKTVPNIDRSGGVLQVLGTPDNQVQFTSLADDSVGGRSDPNDFAGPDKGQWGGIVFRQSSDFIGLPGRQDGRDWSGRGVFLNSVNQARFQFGGGQVYDDSVLRVFTPIHIENLDGDAPRFSRPNVWFNTITSSADAAISAEPNSFANTGDRSGPLVRGNTVTGNSLNAFFIRVRTEFGTPLDTLQLAARIDDTDITYVLAENLIIEGGAGGVLMPNPGDTSRTGWDARVAASLVLDPGVVLKLSGARIEAQIGGSQFLAEGTSSRPVVLTSVRDDLYGAGGTFDTGSDSDAPVAPGDWSGLYFAPNSSGSIDQAVVKYGGGISAVAGSFASFNVIEVQQADVRVAHTLLSNNAGGASSADRDGRLTNANTTVFVRGAQPVLVDNTFVDNLGTAMSFNVNSLNSREVSDWGRRTGFIDAQSQYKNNFGPLIAGNRLGNNAINGMDVRGETVTTEVIWDDADIVHVVRDEIIEDINRHTFGGIRLQSGNESSLVIKLAGPNAGFTVTGIPLDIEDRIGGTLQVIGSASYPVVFTSLNDDTVGAGFLPSGLPQTDTDNDASLTPPQPGSWRSVRLDRYSNDRNVAVALESELTTQSQEQNGTAGTAQFLGSLAAPVASDNALEKKGGNDYQPYGYQVHGVLATAADVDTYSFSANRGTEVWIDISRTSQSLDTVVELVDANGTVLASSNDSLNPADLTGSATPRGLIKDPLLGGDYYTLNPRDAGMRVVLPGAATVNTYFVRVRSNGALTSGIYNLQLRMRQVYEAPGSTIRYADIRYATNGVEVLGLPGRSPLGGEAGENSSGSSSFGNPNQLGNLLTSDMNTLSVSGSLAGATQVDWYQFKIEYDLIQAIGGVNAGDKTWSTIFDIDYADGLTRADTVISVFDEDGNLILIGRDSNIADDQPGPNQGNGLTDMSRGTVGKLDPYIGSVQMPTGAATGEGYTYTVAVSSNGQLPQALNGQFVGFGANGLVRLEPVNSVRRIVEDHIGFIGHQTGIPGLPGGSSQLDPVAPALFPIADAADLAVSVRPYTLQDVVLFGISGGNLGGVNPATGAPLYGLAGFNGAIKMRSDGVLYGYRPLSVADSVGEFVRIDPATGNVLATLSSDGIPNADPDADPPEPYGLTSDLVDAFAFTGNSSSGYTAWLAVRDSNSDNDGNLLNYLDQSRLYRANGTTGQVTDPANEWQGTLDNVSGWTTGLATVNGVLFGVSSGGRLFRINPGDGGTASATVIKNFGVSFTGLSEAPQNLNNGALSGFLFATTAAGQLICFDTLGNEQTVLRSPTGGAVSRVNTTAGQITFSPLDFNLWHPTDSRGSDAGHGINISFDNSREQFDDVQGAGGTSFYFGLENAGSAYTPIPGFGGQYGVLSSQFQQDLTSNFANTSIGNNFNLPGGAAGSLISNNAFSLVGYSATDKPTLYFNYFLQSEDATGNAANATMRDSARVYITTNNGTSWQMLATNNQTLSTSAMMPDAELPTFLSTSRALNTSASNQRVQLLHDNTGGWRQARIDLADFAGQANLKLRFDFSTSGTTLLGSRNTPTATLPGDAYGVGLNNAARGQNNLGEGFYIDDILVGLAERGEMVTGPSNNTGFFTVPTNPDPLAPQQVLSGAYQLEIRRGEEYGVNPIKLAADIVIPSQLDSNQRMSAGWRITGRTGSQLSDGATFTVSDGINSVTYEFDNNSIWNSARRRIVFSNSDSAASIATKVRDAINAARTANLSTVTAQLADSGNTGTNVSATTFVELINAVSVSPSGNSIQASSFNRNGDQNTIRDQGQIQIYANSVSNVSQFGIVVDQGARSATTGQAVPSAPINTPTLNSQRLLPGVNISNNVISNYAAGGIRFEGSGTGSPLGSVPFGRIVNNTLYGGATPQGVGISVADNAGPTIMNNIVANSATGISVDSSSQSRTVVDTTVFQRNTGNLAGISATNTIALTNAQPLFVNPAAGNFYLAPLSPAIDSSRNSLSERSAMSSVKSPLAIPVSPIIAPANDRFGQLRVDDAAVPNASGLGSNIFIDRGAIERGDFSKPKARLTTPLDNGAGIDGDSTPDTVFLTSAAPLTQFVLQLSDVGVGIDHSTVIDAAFVLQQDGVALVSGTDYQFVYNRNTRQVFFQSSSVFPPQSEYRITIPKDTVKDLAGNSLQANQLDGSTVFKIIGNAPPSLTSIDTLSGLKNIAKTISYNDLLMASDLRVVSGHDPQFRIEQVFGNGLTIVKAGSGSSTPVVPGVTIVAAGDVLTWTPIPGNTGITPAFTVRGYDPQNAAVAPALALSPTTVTVTVDLVDVAPTLTTINPADLPSAMEDTVYKLTRSQLLDASNAADQNNDLIRFRVTQVVSGTLLIGATPALAVPVVPGESILDDSVCLFWTPPANLNSELNGGPLAAFRVVAHDGVNDSSPPVLVSIITNAVPDAPILTSISKLSLAGKNSFFKVPFEMLRDASNAQNVDGHAIQFRIASIPTGATLQIRKAATPGVTQSAPVGTIVSAGDVLIYKAPLNVFGDPVNAFQVVAYDGFNAANFGGVVPQVVVSSPAVNVPVQVLNEVAPQLTNINTLVRPRYVPSRITYAELISQSNLVSEPGHTIGLRLDNIDQGTLSRGGIDLVAGDVILPDDELLWNLPGATGTQAAFDLTAVDLTNNLTSLDPVQVSVDLVNFAPVLTRVNNIVLAEEQTPLAITYDRLKGQSDASDANNDTICFVIKSISTNGTLQITKAGVTTTAAVGTKVNPGDTLTWTPAVGVTGTAVQAFSVKASDGLLESDDPNVNVTVQVRAWGSEYSLGGAWTINGRLARITQDGANLTFVNENGIGSAGKYIARDRVQATTYGTTATVDMSAADQGRLLWSNGQIWLRIALGGQWTVLSSPTATNIGKLVSVGQSGSALTFVNAAGVSSSGALLSPTTLSATGLGGTATFGDGVITFANGERWTKLDLALNYTSSAGAGTVTVQQDGTTTLRFVDRLGNTTQGRFLTATRLQDLGSGRTGTISNGQILWSDGEIWTKALVIQGTRAGTSPAQAVSLTATNNLIQATTSTETIGLQLLSLNTIRAKSGSLMGMIGRRQGGKIVWSNGVTWENFDFNALNALFADIQTYPRG
jgi:hypothetical protein